MLYAVQYRNMHTAVHHLSIFSKRSAAKEMLRMVKELEHLPRPEFQGDVANIEINFRKVPSTYKDQKLTIVNTESSIPDCY